MKNIQTLKHDEFNNIAHFDPINLYSQRKPCGVDDIVERGRG
jgi:hypothetical protein